jgi:hypothetical protein
VVDNTKMAATERHEGRNYNKLWLSNFVAWTSFKCVHISLKYLLHIIKWENNNCTRQLINCLTCKLMYLETKKLLSLFFCAVKLRNMCVRSRHFEISCQIRLWVNESIIILDSLTWKWNQKLSRNVGFLHNYCVASQPKRTKTSVSPQRKP